MTICKRKNPIHRILAVSVKDQILIPQDLREEPPVKRGDKLTIPRRKGGEDFTGLKEVPPGKVFEEIANDEFNVQFLERKKLRKE